MVCGGQKLIAELPRAMTDIERVGADSSLLAAQMAQVLDKVSEVERTGQQTVAALATLDAVKTRMEECAQMLAEAESVSRILAQLEPLFQKDELREIAARLGSLRRSLESMGQLEEFSDAAERLKSFEDRLEKRMSSKLKEGIEQLDAQATKECLEVYEQMKRRDILVTRYVQARKSNLVKIYSTFADSKETNEPLPARVTALSTSLCAALQTELDWCESVFPDSATFACSLWVDMTSTISAPLQTLVSDFLFKAEYSEGQLLELRKLIGIVSNLAVSVSEMLSRESLAGEKPQIEVPFTATMNLLEKCQREYPEREAHVLEREQQAARRTIEASKSVNETIRRMEESTGAATASMLASAARAVEVTGGCECVAVNRMLDEVFALHIQVLGGGMQTIRTIAQLDVGPSGKDGAREGGKVGVNGSSAVCAEATAGEGAGGHGKDGEDDMSLIDDDDACIMACDGAQVFPALQGAIKVVSLVERLPTALSDVESAWQQLIVANAPQVCGQACSLAQTNLQRNEV
jgi:hypothetical protein